MIMESEHQENLCAGSQLVKIQLTLRGHGSILHFPAGESATQDSQVPILPPALPYVTSHPADQLLTRQKKCCDLNNNQYLTTAFQTKGQRG